MKLLIVPTLNEKNNIKDLIKNIKKIKQKLDILFIDDNSSDGTLDLIKKKQILNKNINLIINPKKSGVGNAHLMAIKYY